MLKLEEEGGSKEYGSKTRITEGRMGRVRRNLGIGV